jgi:hypothetical protein
VQVLKEAVAAEEVNGGFDGIFSKPLVTYSPEGSIHDYQEVAFAAGSPVTWTSL